MWRVDLAVAAAVTALGVVIAGVAWTLPDGRQPGDLGAGGFPLVVAGALVALGVVRLVGSLRAERLGGTATPVLPVIAMLATGAVVVGLMPLAGFVPMCALLLATGALIAGERRPLHIALFALVTPVAAYALFAFAFAVRLPPGPLEGVLG